MHLDLNIVQTSLLGFCPIEAAVSAMAGSGIEARGAVFTRRDLASALVILERAWPGARLVREKAIPIANCPFGNGEERYLA